MHIHLELSGVVNGKSDPVEMNINITEYISILNGLVANLLLFFQITFINKFIP